MALLETIVVAWGVTTGGASLISGIRTSKSLKELKSRVRASERSICEDIQLISKDISLLKGSKVVVPSNKVESKVYTEDKRVIVDTGESICSALGDKITTSEIIIPPPGLIDVIYKNPEDALVNICPLSSTIEQESGMTPVLFDDRGKQYIGWQKPQVLSLLLGLEVNDGDWVSKSGIHSNSNLLDEIKEPNDTKLELASAFFEMGSVGDAVDVLIEVIRDGNKKQKHKSVRLLLTVEKNSYLKKLLLQTRCVRCDVAFRINFHQIKAASGKVRCGVCHSVFDAISNIE